MLTGMEAVRDAFPNFAELARRLGISRAAISQWKEVPAERLVDIERITGVPRQRLRPELFEGLTENGVAR